MLKKMLLVLTAASLMVAFSASAAQASTWKLGGSALSSEKVEVTFSAQITEEWNHLSPQLVLGPCNEEIKANVWNESGEAQIEVQPSGWAFAETEGMVEPCAVHPKGFPGVEICTLEWRGAGGEISSSLSKGVLSLSTPYFTRVFAEGCFAPGVYSKVSVSGSFNSNTQSFQMSGTGVTQGGGGGPVYGGVFLPEGLTLS